MFNWRIQDGPYTHAHAIGLPICTRSICNALKIWIPSGPVLKHGPRSLACVRVIGQFPMCFGRFASQQCDRLAYSTGNFTLVKPKGVINMTVLGLHWSQPKAYRPISIPGRFIRYLRISSRTLSTYGRTRKMVNYAWSGWSQGKPWWRTEAVLTCKSIVRIGYRGERPIEPSSSWFPPKFPSG